MTMFTARGVWFVGLVALVVCMFSAAPAQAASISINDVAANDTIVIRWADFTRGFSVNGSIFTLEGSLTVNEGTAISFDGFWFVFTGYSGSGADGVNFLEPDSAALSDTFFANYSLFEPFIARITGQFESDSESGLLNPIVGATNLVETGSAQEISQLLSHLPPDLTIQVASDVEAQTVPEPASILLLGTGLVSAARRFRRSNAVKEL